jgi:thiol-disulfide isomerase/thioredoxin
MASSEKSYAEAHQQVLKSRTPMVVMVTADWCPACQTMKSTVIPQVRQHGLLRKVLFTTVNVDRERELGKRLVAGGPIPQLLMYRRTRDGWRLRRLVGGHSTATVEEFINQGVELNDRDQQPKKAAEAPTASAATVSQGPTATENSPGRG